MPQRPGSVLFAVLLLAAALAPDAARAQKPGGTLRVEHMDNPPGLSIIEESTMSVVMPLMAVFNNLVLYRQDVPQNSLASIGPDLATEWAWSEDGLKLAFTLRGDVKWHDGQPFTARDVACTWDLLLGRGEQKLRKNPRESWWGNVAAVTAEGERRAVFELKRPQPALLALLASGWAPIYPCHVPPAAMRAKPIGTGPFTFVEFRANESLKLARNPSYWKPGRPYLDGIEYKIVASHATRMLAFAADQFDMTYPADISVPLMRDVKMQAPQAQCSMRPSNASLSLMVNRDAPPFDKPGLRQALALAIERKPFVDILTEGQGQIGGVMLPPPEGAWGLPPEKLADLPGFGADARASREEARRLMQAAGYGPENRLKLKVVTRNIPQYRNPAVILIDQLKEVFVDAELDALETSTYYARVQRRDFTVAVNLTGNSVDDPDQVLFENYACGSARNYTNYCNPEMEALFDRQSREADPEKRRALVWEIDRKLQADIARPVIYHDRIGMCWQPRVKGLTVMVNSLYNGWRFEDVWLER